MNTRSLLRLVSSFCLCLLVGGCIDWSLDQPPPGPVNCSLYDNAAQRYPGLCGPDGGREMGSGGDGSGEQKADGGGDGGKDAQ